MKVEDLRVAWLVPTVKRGKYWQPILKEFVQFCQKTAFFTCEPWSDFDAKAPGASIVKLVGGMKFITLQQKAGYSRGFIYAPPSVIKYLLKFKPDVIFISGFSIWTVLALAFKPVGKWKVVIMYDGSSPNIDVQDSKIRSLVRKLIANSTDAFVANSIGAEVYLAKGLSIESRKIFTKPYLVPDSQTLSQSSEKTGLDPLKPQHPIFLCVGVIENRKGIRELLEACALLKSQGHHNYSVVLVGDGWQRQELENLTKQYDLQEQVTWVGWVEYSHLGRYFALADVFIFPTLEDIWGMVVLEAMVFGKPILCSKWAGATEMVIDGKNGFIFDPHSAQETAAMMSRFIENQSIISEMGHESKQLIAKHTPAAAAKFFSEVSFAIMNQSGSALSVENRSAQN